MESDRADSPFSLTVDLNVLDVAAVRVVESYERRVVDGLEGWHRIM